MVKQMVLKYDGNNSLLFERKCVDLYDAETKIIVPETHNAILLKDGQMMDTLSSGEHRIFDTSKGKKIGSYTVEVIFMSKTARLKVGWGTMSKFTFRDNTFNFPYKAGAYGEYEVQISNPRKAYLQLIGADTMFTVEKLKDRLTGRTLAAAEPIIARFVRAHNIDYDGLQENKDLFASEIKPVVSEMFENDYGLKLFSFTIGNIAADPEDVAEIEGERRRLRARKERKSDEVEEELKQTERENRVWEREKYKLDLEYAAREKYMDVTREIGWETKAVQQKTCPECGAVVKEGDKFCPECGRALSGKNICPKCSKVNQANAKFCVGCGYKF